jgi:hypothetical protein
MGLFGRIPHPYLVYRITWDAEHAARLRRTMEDPCLYATNPLFGADGEGARFPIESPSVARARWVGLPEMPNCSVSAYVFGNLVTLFNIVVLTYLSNIMMSSF